MKQHKLKLQKQKSKNRSSKIKTILLDRLLICRLPGRLLRSGKKIIIPEKLKKPGQRALDIFQAVAELRLAIFPAQIPRYC